MSKITVIGAGKTGRGFVGRLLAEEGKMIQFIDKNRELIKEMNMAGRYEVSYFGDSREKTVVSRYTAHTWSEADFSDTELIFVSVCGPNLKDVGAELRSRLSKTKQYYIITCENAANPSPYLQCNADLLKGYVPEVANVTPIENFGNFLTRKLFTYNAASCIIAYVGWNKGYTDYAAAANDEEILKLLDKNYEVTNKVLCREFGYEKADQEEFALLSKKKFCDKTIVDTVARNARQPQRKLGKAERIIGPMLLIDKYGEDTSVLEMTAAIMLMYTGEGEDEWEEIKKNNSPEQILENICGLEKGSRLYEGILNYYRGKVDL